jgi:Protein of unknown function (DUF1592)/Protein of unknown function (DUF1588)/Protein of unknown function (DUF1595)/Protein of unknown function (DUF1585)/Protein of unknown function (DUF1587)
MMRTRTIHGVLGLLLLGGSACYTGLGGSSGAGGADDAAGSDDGVAGSEGESTAGESGGAADAAVSPSDVARLTRLEYERTVTAIFGAELAADVDFEGLPADGRLGRFESNAGLDVNIDSVDAYRIVAEDVGEAAGARAASLLGCEESPECVAAFITSYGRFIYRRSLSAGELDVFVQFWNANREGGELADAMRLVVTALLQTPDFLYRLEKGGAGDDGEVRRLTGEEVASRLSFFLWKSGPDTELLDAAAAGDLDSAEGLLAQAERLLADPRADDTLVRFHNVWLGIDAFETELVDAERFPEFEALRADMIDETRQFILHVIREDDAQVSTLFTAEYSFASPELAAFYGDGVASSDDGEITLDPRQRMGLLTHASYLTAHARTPERAPIYRGRSLLVDMFCKQLTPPPNVNTTIDFDSSSSARQQIEDATAGPACTGCHRMINPLGFLFENYDGVGQWRTMDGVYPVEAAAEVVGTDIDGAYANATELITRLGDSADLQACVSRQWMRFALSRPEGSEDEGSIVAASEQAGGDIHALIGALTQTDAFRHRRLPQP